MLQTGNMIAVKTEYVAIAGFVPSALCEERGVIECSCCSHQIQPTCQAVLGLNRGPELASPRPELAPQKKEITPLVETMTFPIRLAKTAPRLFAFSVTPLSCFLTLERLDLLCSSCIDRGGPCQFGVDIVLVAIVFFCCQDERPIGPGRGGKGKKSEPGGHDDATRGQKTGQQTSPEKGPAGRSQAGRGASSGRSSPQRKSYQQDNKASGSSAQLMGRIMACTDLNSLDQVVNAEGQRFDYQKVSAAMTKVVKLHRRNQKAMAQRMMQDLSVLALGELNNMNARTLVSVLWALAKFGGPVNPALVQGILVRTKEELASFNAQEISNVLWAMAKLCVPSNDLVHDIMDAAKRRLPDFNAQGLSNTEAKLKLPDFNAQNLSNTLWAAANLGIEDAALNAAWLSVAKLKLPDFNVQNLSNSLWAVANLCIEDAAFNAAWLSVSKLKLPDFNGQELSNSLWAVANLGIEDEAFNAAWLSVAKQKLPNFNAQELSNTLWAAANLGIKDDDFASSWMIVAKVKLPQFDVQALSSNLLSATDQGTEAPTVQVVGDASKKALAAYTPNGELRQPIIQPFSKGELKAVQDDKWSSTARELAVVKLALEVMEEQRPGYLSGKRFQYGTDCEIAVMMMRMVAFPDAPLDSPFLTSSSGKYAHDLATAMGMKGGPGTVPLVKDIRLLCDKLGVELDVVWRRRNHPEQQVADDLSKVEDNEDWSLHQGVYLNVLEHPCLQGRRPTLDVFASGANTKVQGAYYSNYLGVGCLGVDAFQHPWVREGAPREEQLAYIHGPFHLLPQILQRVSEEQVDCIVITPGLSGPWVALLSGLPVQATMELPMKADLLVAGALVPSKGRGGKRPKDPLQASFILWGNKQDAQD
eukprot:gene11140-biopygen12596